MILYTLACEAGHRFDSWFRDSAGYDDQRAAAAIACPTCASTEIAKAVMAPAVLGGRGMIETSPGEVALIDDASRELRALLKGVRDKIVAEGHDVGARFPEEARRMHEGETPVRRIYGEASIAEARDLLAEGIMVMPLPIVPDELN